jgi:hypothetical protein
MKMTRRGFAGIGLDHACDLGGRCVGELRVLGRRGHKEADQLATQFVQRRQRSQLLHAIHIQGGLAHRSAEDHELLVGLGEIGGDLRCRDRIVYGVSDQGRPLQKGHDGGGIGAIKSVSWRSEKSA